MEPQFRFCTSADGTRITYATYGAGQPLLIQLGWATSFEAEWKDPESRAWTQELARHYFVIRCERRGFGSSADSVPGVSLDKQVSDLTALAERHQLPRIALFGAYDAAAVAAAFASRFPERVERLVLWAPFARGRDLGSPAALASLEDLWTRNWKLARRSWSGQVFPGDSHARAQWYNEVIRESFSPGVAAAYARFIRELDVTEQLTSIQAPTLVLARDRDRLVPASLSRAAAAMVPDASFISISGDEGHPSFGNRDYVRELKQFLGAGAEPTATTQPASGTVVILFTDIADSTVLTERLGDTAFRDRARALDDALRVAIRGAGGSAVEGKLLGDGVLATFSGAAQAIAAARSCVDAATTAELPLHIGLHAGDVIHERDNVYGGAVNIASRICGLCEPGEILVSQTVRDLARTSAGVSFEDRGEHALKGIADTVRVFAVRADRR